MRTHCPARARASSSCADLSRRSPRPALPLAQLEGVDSNNDGVLFMGATNLPWEIDAAMIRRFQKKILIPLPEAPARVRMFVGLGGPPFGEAAAARRPLRAARSARSAPGPESSLLTAHLRAPSPSLPPCAPLCPAPGGHRTCT